jgi:ATPase subunit of ABC transporter with duplicated ATPase domains
MLSVNKIGYETSGHSIFRNVSLSINKGEKIGLVGRNGVGKTTLLNILAGKLEPTEGAVNTGGYEVGVLPQDLRDWLDRTVYEFIEETTGVTSAREGFEASCAQLEESSDEKTLLIYSDALDAYTRYDVGNFNVNLAKALSMAGIQDIDVDKEIGNLSGGQKTRIALAALFASRYDVILLDEPTNNLDTNGVVVLEKFIGNSNAAFMMISHDRRFLRNATSRIIELMGGDDGITQYGLGYDEYVAAREAAREAAFKKYEDYEKEKKRLKKAAREANIRANSANSNSGKSDNDKLTANFRSEKAAKGVAKSATALTTRIGQLRAPELPSEEISLSFNFKEAEGKRSVLMTAENLSAKYNNNDRIFGPINLHLQLGDRIAITGDNGVGKSTLVKTLIGQITPYSGSIQFGKDSKIVYMDQQQSVPYPEKNAIQNLQAMSPDSELHDIINLLVRFGIKKEVIENIPAQDLSGGERGKILLASIVARQANILVMDEPTNNLDIPTIEALERALKTYNGSIILVSHDRDFLTALRIHKEIKI